MPPRCVAESARGMADTHRTDPWRHSTHGRRLSGGMAAGDEPAAGDERHELHCQGIGVNLPITYPLMYPSTNTPTTFTTLSCNAPGERFDRSSSAGSKTAIATRRGLKGAHGVSLFAQLDVTSLVSEFQNALGSWEIKPTAPCTVGPCRLPVNTG